MRVSKKCINMVKEFEGCYLKAYQDAVGVWTIGYGITSSDKTITGKTIKKGMVITKKTADKWLEESLNKKYLPLVMKYQNVYYKFNTSQIDALVSFAFNIGSIDGLTAKGTRSISEIEKKILLYNKAGGKELKGLTRRREAELDFFLKGKKTFDEGWPTLPKRGYFEKGDKSKEVGKLEKLMSWLDLYDGDVDDNVYGEQMVEATKKLQRQMIRAGHTEVKVNGKFGNLCLPYVKKLKR